MKQIVQKAVDVDIDQCNDRIYDVFESWPHRSRGIH